MDRPAVTTSGGIGFVGGLTLLFITLKLLGVISWSWGWVLSPLWIVALLFGIYIIVAFFFIVVRK